MLAKAHKTQVAKQRDTRTKRLNIRATERQEKLIRLGAESKGLNVSSFMVASACTEAEHSLADQTHFSLPRQKWTRFLAALDRPAKSNRALAKLMLEPSVLER